MKLKIGRIFKIVNNVNDLVYVGSAIDKDLRLVYNRYRNGEENALSKYMKHIGGCNFTIELLEEFKFNNILALKNREIFWKSQIGTLNAYFKNKRNKKIEKEEDSEKIKLSKQEINKKYYEKHREENLQNKKEYRDNNKDKIKEWNKKHYEKYREQILKYKKEYCIKNKEKIEERRTRDYECECGRIVNLGDKSKHLKTKIHNDLMALKSFE